MRSTYKSINDKFSNLYNSHSVILNYINNMRDEHFTINNELKELR